MKLRFNFLINVLLAISSVFLFEGIEKINGEVFNLTTYIIFGLISVAFFINGFFIKDIRNIIFLILATSFNLSLINMREYANNSLILVLCVMFLLGYFNAIYVVIKEKINIRKVLVELSVAFSMFLIIFLSGEMVYSKRGINFYDMELFIFLYVCLNFVTITYLSLLNKILKKIGKS